jgi:hypothetical protein
MPTSTIAPQNNSATLDKVQIPSSADQPENKPENKPEHQASILPFETYSQGPNEFEVVSDGRGTAIKIPRHGSLNFVEYRSVQRLILQVTKREESETVPYFDYEVERAALLLRMRFNLPDGLATEEILKTPSGRPFTNQMIDEINKFFDREEKGVSVSPETASEAESGGAPESTAKKN